MNHPIDTRLQEPKKLSPADRTALIDALLELNDPPDPEWKAAWIQECEDRLAALDLGEMESFDFDEVMAEVRARLKRV